jgi:hypothetical protein
MKTSEVVEKLFESFRIEHIEITPQTEPNTKFRVSYEPIDKTQTIGIVTDFLSQFPTSYLHKYIEENRVDYGINGTKKNKKKMSFDFIVKID